MRRSRRDDVPPRELAAWREHLVAIRPDADVTEADWWETEWPDGTPAAVGFLIPRGFEAYARVLHPAHDHEGDAVTWATVASECGTTLHSEAQWWRVARRGSSRGGHGTGWPGNEPLVGTLDRPRFEALADVLAGHTTTPERTFVAFWVGYGLWPRAWDGAPTTQRPGRESYVFERPLADMTTLCAEAPAVGFALGESMGSAVVFYSDGSSRIPTPDEQFETAAPHQWQSPSAWWPADRAWATSNDTDLDSTLVGGTRALVDDLLADERLEVLPWPVDGSLWADADTINA
jgi:hypothetical protein